MMKYKIMHRDSVIAEADRLRMTKTSALAPARSKILAVSYSQFVPGNTGIRTFGRAVLMVENW